HARELLDDPALVLTDLPANLRDIRRLNRWLGGTRIALGQLAPLLPDAPAVSLLDVATGSGDFPLAATHWASRKGMALQATGLDSSTDVLAEARELCRDTISLMVGDARSLDVADESFDVVTCCLALHHFSEPDAAQVLAEMWRVARHAILVVDLTRGYVAYAGTWLAVQVMARSRLTCHDGPLSVLRAFTPPELRRLAVVAGVPHSRVTVHPLFRQVLVARKDSRGG
ncbi:MAG: methyltransferase domain-containing protein, partial [Chloroflexota bacterium]|nr:methyltransferase domain-containing protein [Chloroflexota bacterium]